VVEGGVGVRRITVSFTVLVAALLLLPAVAAGGEEGKGGEGQDEGGTPLNVVGVQGLGFELGGYFRSRLYHHGDFPLDIMSSTEDYLGTVEYLDTRLKLAPVIKWADVLRVEAWFHILDDVVWGDNAGISSTGITASDPSSTNRQGDEMPLINVRAAWVEMNLKVLAFRIGRMPSDWGLGLLTSGSAGLDDDFSWNRDGSIYDRVLVATEPVTIVLSLMKAKQPRFPLIVAYSFDQLVEDDIAVGGTRLPYSSGWLGDNGDDVREHNVALVYEGDPVRLVTDADKLVAGAYVVLRDQKVTYSDLVIFDAFMKLRLGPDRLNGFFEGEGYFIRGSTMAFPLGGHPEEAWCQAHGYTRCPDWLYTRKDAEIAAWIFRLGVAWKALPKVWLTVKLETGYASGDKDPTDRTFKSMAGHSDLKVGLVLYDVLLYELTRQSWTDNPGLWSNGGIYNSYYALAMAKVTLLGWMDFLVQGIAAWPDEADGTIIMDDKFLGFEFDAGARVRLYRDHAILGLEGGVFKAGKGLERKNALSGKAIYPELPWTIQFWAAYVI
jgi:hypothetical protein